MSHTFRCYLACLGLVAGLAIPVHAGYAYVYDIVFLDTFDRYGGHAYRINEANQIIGWIGGGPLGHAQVFWDLNDLIGDGETHIISDAFPPPMYCTVAGINDRGQVVGSYDPDPYSIADRPFIYNAHTRTWLDIGTLVDDDDENPHQDPWLDYYSGFALAINNSGTVLGVSQEGVSSPEKKWLVTKWSAPDSPAALADMGTHEVNWISYDLNNFGEGSGFILFSLFEDPHADERRGFRSDGSGVNLLPIPSGYRNRSDAPGINDTGQTVGYARFSNNPIVDHPVLWNKGQLPIVLETYGRSGHAKGINNHGDIVGWIGGGAFLWTWTGINYQPIDLSRYVRPAGNIIGNAFDINDQGLIVGYAKYGVEGFSRPVALIPRIDEEPPTASLRDDEPYTGQTDYEFKVIYMDNGVIDEDTIDDSDLTVTGPNGYEQDAEPVNIGSPQFAADEDSWYQEVTYRIQAPGGIWDGDDVGTYSVMMNGDEVADGAAYHVAEGELGSFDFNAETLEIWMDGGNELYGEEKAASERFNVSIDTAILTQIMFPVQNVWIKTPNEAEYFLDHQGGGLWALTAGVKKQPEISDFGDGMYTFYLDFEMGFVVDREFWYGIPETTDPIPQPTELPAFISPVHGAVDVPVSTGFTWTPPTDASVNSMRMEVTDIASERIVESVLFEEVQTSGWPYASLLHSHSYRAALTFRHGYYDQLQNEWGFSASKYNAHLIEFTTSHPDPATYTVGDLDGKGPFRAACLVILGHYLAGNIFHDDAPFTEPLMAADMNGDRAIEAVDLLLMANRAAEN